MDMLQFLVQLPINKPLLNELQTRRMFNQQENVQTTDGDFKFVKRICGLIGNITNHDIVFFFFGLRNEVLRTD